MHVTQRRKTRPEVIEHHRHAVVREVLHRGSRNLRFRHERAFRQFEAHTRGRHAVPLQKREHLAGELRPRDAKA